MAEWLDGKKTIIAGALVMVLNLLATFGVVTVPAGIQGGIDAVLGGLVIIFRITATKNLTK